MNPSIITIDNLHVHFNTYAGIVHAVNGVSFDVRPGEMFGLVGESGCGKTVTGLSVMRAVPSPGRIVEGQIYFQGEDILRKSETEMKDIRGGRIAMIFQDPTASLNPVFTVGYQISLQITQHRHVSKQEAKKRALAMFSEVGLPNVEAIYNTYPHELSGGMQQRVMIAMGLASGAKLLIADEPTTALDVTIQAQILTLLSQLREHEGLTILLITHDLGVIAETCDRVAVTYNGRIVEIGIVNDVLYKTKHPYTQGLLAALPETAGHKQSLAVIKGSVPDGLQSISGCSFHPRCPKVMEICLDKPPSLFIVGEEEHSAACFLYKEELG